MGSFNSDGKAILTIFIGVILAIAFINPIADKVVQTTNLITVTNATYTAPATNATLAIVGRELVSQTGNICLANNVSNCSNGLYLASAIGTDGERSVFLYVNQTGAGYAGASVNVSYVAEPDDYQNSTTRPIVILLTLFAALGVLVYVISTLIKRGSLGGLIKRWVYYPTSKRR